MSTLEQQVVDVYSTMKTYDKSGEISHSFVEHGKPANYAISGTLAKFTVLLLEISEQGNVVSQMKLNNESQKKRKKESKKTNFPQPFFSYFLHESFNALLPFVVVAVRHPTSTSKTAQEKLKISSVWLVNHLYFINAQLKPESNQSCKKLSQNIKSSCYSSVMSNYKNNERKLDLEQTQSQSKSKLGFRFQFKTPADQFNPVNLISTLGSFLNLVGENETWDYGWNQEIGRAHV